MLASFARRDTRICSFSTSCTTRKPNAWKMALSPRATPRARYVISCFAPKVPSTDSSWCPISSKAKEDDTFEQTEEEISKLADSFVEYLCVQAPDPNSPLEAKGRWDTHVTIAQAGELWRAPYRIPYEFCLNEACTEVGFNLAVPCKFAMAPNTLGQRC